MSTRNVSRSPQGIRVRHSRSCRSRDGASCNCRPAYEAWVFLRREGKKVRKTFPTIAAAKSWRADATAAANRGKLRPPSPTTLREAAEAFITGARDGAIPTRSGRRYKPATLRGYERALRLRVLPELGDMRLSNITRADIQDFADGLTAEGLAPSTIHNTLDPLRKVFDRAVRRDIVAIDPTDSLELRRPHGRRDRIASPTEAATLLAVLHDDERGVYATAMYAGLRRGELRALRWTDVDLNARLIAVARSWDDVEGEQEGKSEAALRRVPILDPLLRELAAAGLRTNRTGDALVFGETASVPFDPSTVRRRARAAWKEQGMAPIGLHEARHTCASLLIASGANAKVIQAVMGHATIAMTFDTYGHLMPGGLEEAALAANSYLAEATHGNITQEEDDE